MAEYQHIGFLPPLVNYAEIFPIIICGNFRAHTRDRHAHIHVLLHGRDGHT